jgi:GMP synthase (glutamine-hydrolysing)
MRIHLFQHVPFEGLGSIEPWIVERGYPLTVTHFYAGETPPPIAEMDWLIVMGGPMNIYEEDRYPWLVEEKRCLREAVAAGKTLLGVCLGAQLLADVLGARVYRNVHKEIGWFPVYRVANPVNVPLAGLLPESLEAFHWHGDTFELPAGAVHLASSDACQNQAFAVGNRLIGLQFHLETTPETAAGLIEHCSDELIEGPFIQTAPVMLEEPSRFDAINGVMRRLLEYLEQ